MRAIIISPYIPREKTGGSGIKTAHTLDAILSISKECEFFCFYSTQEELDFLIALQNKNNNLTVFPLYHDFSFRSSSPIDLFKKGYYYRRFHSILLKKILKKRDCYDLAFLDSMFSYQYKECIKAKRWFIDFHNIHSEILSHYLKKDDLSIRSFFIKREHRYLLKKENEIFKDKDISKITTGELPDYHIRYNDVCFNHIPFIAKDHLEPIRKWDDKDVLFTGNFIWNINREAIDVFYYLSEQFKEIRFTLAGKGLNILESAPQNLRLIKAPEKTKSLFNENAIFLSPVDNPSGVNIKLIQAALNGNMIIAKEHALRKIPGLIHSAITYNDMSELYEIIKNISLPIKTDHTLTIKLLKQNKQDFLALLKGI